MSKTPYGTPVAEATPDENDTVSIASFTDIEDDFAKDYINALLKAGVFGKVTSDKFNPYEPVTRSEYVRWMIIATNTLFPEGEPGHISLKGLMENHFEDVNEENPDFNYIQALRDREYIIDVKKNHFEPDKNITREELMMIRCSLEYNIKYLDIKDLKTEEVIAGLQSYFRDGQDINRDYLIAFQKDKAYDFPILFRTFGTTKKFYPGNEVTRSEAAASIGVIFGKSLVDFVNEKKEKESE